MALDSKTQNGAALQVEKLRADLHAAIEQAIDPLTARLAALGIRPNQVTAAGTLICLGAAILVVLDRPVAAGVVWLAGSAFDLVDGALARRRGQASPAGAFLDSTLDRVSEGALFAAIAYRFAAAGAPTEAALAALALLGAMLVSYTRARAEGLGIQCKVGLITRAERVMLVGLGLCFGVLEPAIYLLVALCALTVAQRIRHSVRTLR